MGPSLELFIIQSETKCTHEFTEKLKPGQGVVSCTKPEEQNPPIHLFALPWLMTAAVRSGPFAFSTITY